MTKATTQTISQEKFILAFRKGNLKQAISLYATCEIDIHEENDLAFRLACYYGYLSMAQWVLSLGGVDIHAEQDFAFRMACYFGHIRVAKWLYDLGGVDVHINDDSSLVWACSGEYLALSAWLCTITTFKQSKIDDIVEILEIKKKKVAFQKLFIRKGYSVTRSCIYRAFSLYVEDAVKKITQDQKIYLNQLLTEYFDRTKATPLGYLAQCPEWQKATVMRFVV